jgi:hypothetical protein
MNQPNKLVTPETVKYAIKVTGLVAFAYIYFRSPRI